MKQKKHMLKNISAFEMHQKIRKPMPPVGSKHKTDKDYNRKPKHKKPPSDD